MWGGDGAEVAHELCGGLGNISAFAKALRVGHAMIALIRRGEAGELIVLRPVEIAAVNDRAADTGGMTIHIFRGGMSDNIRAKFEGTAVDRGGEGVIHNQRHAVRMCGLRKLLNIQHVEGGVGERLRKHRLCVGAEGCV